MERGPALEAFVGAIAGPAACVFSNPVEIVKNRLQVQGERGRGFRVGGFLRTAQDIAAQEGLAALQKGLAPALGYNFVLNGTRFALYDALLRAAGERRDDGGGSGSSGVASAGVCVAAGTASGLVAGSLAAPFAVLKVRSQIRTGLGRERSVGFQHGRSGSLLAGLHGLRLAHGVGGLSLLAYTQGLRVGSASGMMFWAFDACKHRAGLDTFSASVAAAVVSAVVMNPFDLACTRLFNQPADERRWYRGALDAMRQTVRAEGPFGLLKGLSASLVRQVPHTGATLVLGDWLRLRLASPSEF